MKVKYLFTFILLIISNTIFAQSHIDSLWQYSSFVYNQYDDIYTNPAQLHLLPFEENINITLKNRYFKSPKDKNYNIYEGNKYLHNNILAEGYRKNKASTVYGFGLFNKNINYNVRFNNIANYKIFYPYISGTEILNNQYTESYSIGGAYSHQLGNIYLGLSAYYLGGVLYSLSDPRSENKFSDININIGGSYNINKYNLGLNIYYKRYNESVDILIKKSGIKTLFYSMSGLGLYDYKYSILDDNFSRFIINDKFGVGLSLYERNMKGLFSKIDFSIDKSKNIDPKERITSELNRFNNSIKIGYILYEGDHIFRIYDYFIYHYSIGKENIYTKYYVHRNPDIIDYNLFISQKNESIKDLTNSISLEYRYIINKNNQIEIINKNYLHKYQESFKNKEYFVDYSNINSELALGYRTKIKNNLLNTYMSAGIKRNIYNMVSLPDNNNILETSIKKYFGFKYKSTQNLGLNIQYIRPIYKKISISIGVGYKKYFGEINYNNIESQISLIF